MIMLWTDGSKDLRRARELFVGRKATILEVNQYDILLEVDGRKYSFSITGYECDGFDIREEK